MTTPDATNGIVPLQIVAWLAYSLISRWQAGLAVSDIDGFTAEYRSAGWPSTPACWCARSRPSRMPARRRLRACVEWRALTVALLDRLADSVRKKLNMNAETLPLAKILEGGTWATGRLLARERRADGSPPIKVISDGTVF